MIVVHPGLSSISGSFFCSHPQMKPTLPNLGDLCQHGIWAFIHVLKFLGQNPGLLKIRNSKTSTGNEDVGIFMDFSYFFSKNSS